MLKRMMLSWLCLIFPMLAAASTISLTDTKGLTHTLEDYRGKWVLINLWATWCAPCLAEMPELEALSKSREDLEVIGVAADGEDARRIALFAEKLHVTYPVVAGDEKLLQQFKPKGFPTSVLYDPSGKQVLLKEGPISRAEIESMIGSRKGK